MNGVQRQKCVYRYLCDLKDVGSRLKVEDDIYGDLNLKKLNSFVFHPHWTLCIGVSHLKAPDLKRENSFKVRTCIVINIIMVIVLIQKLIQRWTTMDLKRIGNVIL